VGFRRKRSPSDRLTCHPRPGWTSSPFVPELTQNLSAAQLLPLSSLATFCFLSWKNDFPSQAFPASQDLISQGALPRLQQPPESIPHAAKTLAVPGVMGCSVAHRSISISYSSVLRCWDYLYISSDLLPRLC